MWFSRKVFSWGAGNDPGPVTTSVDGAQFFCISYLFFFVSHIFLYFIFFCISYVIFFVSHIFFCIASLFFTSHVFLYLIFLYLIFFLLLICLFFCISNIFFVSHTFFLCISYVFSWYLKGFFFVSQNWY